MAVHESIETSILDSRAKLQPGTFTDYLDSCGVGWRGGDDLTLSDLLGHIPEIHLDSNDPFPHFIQAIRVLANTAGEVQLEFFGYPRQFATEWERDFPMLSKVCALAKEPNTLNVLPGMVGKGDSRINQFLSTRLLPQLTYGANPVWMSFRALDGKPQLTRLAYYFMAVFILGSAVRYEPELVAANNSRDSETGWMLRRFLNVADQHFPQLLLWYVYQRSEIYFN